MNRTEATVAIAVTASADARAVKGVHRTLKRVSTFAVTLAVIIPTLSLYSQYFVSGT